MIDYEREILRVLCEASADGLSVYKISVHVHNAANSLFDPVTFKEVHKEVQAWLLSELRKYNPLVCRCKRRGYYKMNLHSAKSTQLFLCFEPTKSDINEIGH